jgi:trans-aconitate 2-methyltransferase
LERVPLEAPERVFDLGCGTGEATRLISDRWPRADIVGLDSSPEMLARAAAEPGRVRWQRADVGDWRPDAPADLLYSNAALHWVEGHEILFPALLGRLRAGGCLAVQMPLSWDLPSHRLMRETLADARPGGGPLGSSALRHAAERRWVEAPRVYYDLLSGRARSLDVWTTEYLQVLEGADPVLGWVEGSGLRPILQGLEPEARARFRAEYARRLRIAYPAGSDGRTVYPFRRLFVVATV